MLMRGKKLKNELVYSHASVTKYSDLPTRILPPMDFRIPPIDSVGSASATIAPQTLNIWGEMASLEIALGSPANADMMNEYIFMFDSGATPTVLTLPSNVKFTSAVTIEANMYYEVNIVYNQTDQTYYGFIVGWAIS